MRPSTFQRTLALAALSLSATALAQTPDKPAATPSFEVAVIRANPTALPEQGQWSLPNTGNFKATALPLTLLIHLAYDIDTRQIANQPKWLTTKLFDVAAQPESGIKLSREELRPRLQNLLRQRFHLVVHHETRDVAGYALVAAKHGAKLQPTTHPEKFHGFRSEVHAGKISGFNWTPDDLAAMITSVIDHPVVNRTGLTGSYDIDLSYAPDIVTDSPLPPLFSAIDETLAHHALFLEHLG
ncbi:MAG: TIGR03435 family protein, partial [Acidobacteriota bacterium]